MQRTQFVLDQTVLVRTLENFPIKILTWLGCFPELHDAVAIAMQSRSVTSIIPLVADIALKRPAFQILRARIPVMSLPELLMVVPCHKTLFFDPAVRRLKELFPIAPLPRYRRTHAHFLKLALRMRIYTRPIWDEDLTYLYMLTEPYNFPVVTRDSPLHEYWDNVFRHDKILVLDHPILQETFV